MEGYLKRHVLFFVCIPVFMLALSYAAVPLYRVFCSATGYGGTVKRAEVPINRVGDRVFEVSFNADVDSNLKWSFVPLQNKVFVKTGERKLVFYKAENLTNEEVVGMAVYNVAPELAGKYFNKIACFCFSNQVLAPHESAIMPISFFIDPDIEMDPDIGNIEQITLSYTFFRIK